VVARLCVILDGKLPNRGLELVAARTRALKRYDIHELIITDAPQADAQGKIDSVFYLGFAEIRQGGVVSKGDSLLAGGLRVGTVLGFDESHFPNHLNIVIHAETGKTGRELGFELEAPLFFTKESVDN
jgi:hypothetical protein